MKISGVVIAKNEEGMLKDCLDSLKFCDEIIVIDNDSKDKTELISKKEGAKVFTLSTNDFSELRNEGLRKASGDWILYIDADERVTEELKNEITDTIKNPAKFGAYKLKRKNYYLGKTQWPKVEKLERLFKKENLKEWYGKVHETPKIDGKIGELKNYMVHYTHRDLNQMLKKTIEWSDIEADLRFKTNHPKMSGLRFFKVMVDSFLNSYIKEGGIKAGTAGLIESIYQAYSSFITYAKLWEKQNEKKDES